MADWLAPEGEPGGDRVPVLRKERGGRAWDTPFILICGFIGVFVLLPLVLIVSFAGVG